MLIAYLTQGGERMLLVVSELASAVHTVVMFGAQVRYYRPRVCKTTPHPNRDYRPAQPGASPHTCCRAECLRAPPRAS